MKKHTTKDKYMQRYEKQFIDLLNAYQLECNFFESDAFDKLDEVHRSMEEDINDSTIDLLDSLAIRITDYHALNKGKNMKMFTPIWDVDTEEDDRVALRKTMYALARLLCEGICPMVVACGDKPIMFKTKSGEEEC